MVQTGVLILGFTLFVLLFFTVATLIYVPKVLGSGREEEEESNGHTA